MTDYRFPTRIEKIQGKLKKRDPTDLEWEPAPKERGDINGRQVGSFAEWAVAMALWFLRLEFHYKFYIVHTPYFVDFYVNNGIEWVPVDVVNFSKVMETSEQRFRVATIERILDTGLRVIYDYEVTTFDGAVNAVRRII